MESNRSYRIRTEVGKNETYKIDVPLTQTYDMFEILSLKLKQNNQYKFYDADYGVCVGRVLANGGFGIPNAKISIFIEVDSNETNDRKILYNFTSTRDTNYNGVRYNLLPDFVDNACHQDVGTFPNKRLVLDNQDVLEVFEKYYKYTTTTNNSGDFMLYGVPTGMQNLHVDIDLSDIGVLSQRPRDMVYKGYNINQFESPNKFKQSTNLNSLSQIYTQDKGVYVYPYWGNSNNGEETVGITRCDINIDYTFEPTAIFMGSVITDKASNSINQKCTANKNAGRMSELIGGEGDIEMIRKTVDGKVEEFSIKGNRLIDSDGVWCYQIPMNLDYITTNEFGETVPTDNPSKGIPTRARVRFRIKMDNTIDDNATATNRCMYLVPNNPKLNDDFPVFSKTLEPDYEFGSATNDESYKDLFWNCVYTVKNYIPKLQKNSKQNNRQHTGIKWINHGDNVNQMPYNSLTIKLGFMYRLICIITKVIINLIEFINQLVSLVGALFGFVKKIIYLPIEPLKMIPFAGDIIRGLIKKILDSTIGQVLDLFVVRCIGLDSNFCDDGVNKITYYPGCGKLFANVASYPKFLGMDETWKKTQNHHQKEQEKIDEVTERSIASNSTSMLYTCIENQLAQDNDVTSFNFCNDWVNGVLYLPLWYRKITKKKKFLFITVHRAKDQWCSTENRYDDLRILQTCSVSSSSKSLSDSSKDETYINFNNVSTNAYVNTNDDCGKDCHDKTNEVKGLSGVIQSKSVLSNTKTAYYYKSVEVIDNEVKKFFATDIVLLGSLNDCDTNGIPQFFKKLPSTTYILPNDILFTDNDVNIEFDEKGNVSYSIDNESVETGCDWGNLGGDQCSNNDKTDGGLFYGIGCSTIEMKAKSCINLRRICEIGVSKDIISEVGVNEDKTLAPDGYISYDELYDVDARAMFATMNGNNLRTKMDNKTGYKRYDFFYLYPNNFDGSMGEIMEKNQKNCNKSYKNNYTMENFNADYYQFRMGQDNQFYVTNGDGSKSFPVFDNSFYFYFGIKSGSTAIDKFNAQFFASCESVSDVEDAITIIPYPNTWCALNSEKYDSYITLDLGLLSLPCDIEINSVEINGDNISLTVFSDEKIYVGKNKGNDDTVKDYVYKGGINGEIGLKNGTYNISITDNDGNLTISTFELKTPYLTYKYNVVNFNISNDEIDKTYGGNANSEYIKQNNEINNASDKTDEEKYKDKKNNAENRKKLGGYIEITDIQQNKKPLLFDYFIGAYSKETNSPIEYYDNMIFVPYGDYDYNIVVAQICSNMYSPNSVEQTVTVKQKQPIKLFINDIDYDLISSFDKEQTKWINLSDKTIYDWKYYKYIDYYTNQIVDIINQYTIGDDVIKNLKSDIKSNLCYKEFVFVDNNIEKGLKKYINNITIISNENKENILKVVEDIWNKWDEEREDVINKMIYNFSIVCEDTPSEIYLRLENYDDVIFYEINGQSEEVKFIEDDEEIHILSDKTTKILTDTSELDDILIPTITSKETEKTKRFYVSGKNEIFYNDYYLTYDYQNNYGSKYTKKPYNITVNVGSKKICNNFNIHFLDKIFDTDMMSWSYIYNIPFYTDDVDKKGNFINLPGFVTAEIFNGTPMKREQNNETQLLVQKVDNLEIKILSKNSESDIPTKRYIVEDIVSKIKYLSEIINVNDNDIINFYIKWLGKGDKMIFIIINYYDTINNILNNDDIKDKVSAISDELNILFSNEIKNTINNILNNDDIKDKVSAIIKIIVNNDEIIDDFSKIISTYINTNDPDYKENLSGLLKSINSITDIIVNGFYKNYKYNKELDIDNTLSIVLPSPLSLLMLQTSDGCSYNNNVSPLMSIEIDGSSVEDSNNSKLVFNLKNGNSDTYNYYIFRCNNFNDYPLNNANIIQLNNVTICVWDANNNNLFNVDKDLNSGYEHIIKDSTEIMKDLTNDINIKDGKFYIIAESLENTRCISCVYDFMHINFRIKKTVKYDINNKKIEDKIYFIFGQEYYYLNNYKYDLQLLNNNNVIYNNADIDNLDGFNSQLQYNPLVDKYILNDTVKAEITDVTSLKHKNCTIDKVVVVLEEFTIEFIIDGLNIENVPESKLYKKGEVILLNKTTIEGESIKWVIENTATNDKNGNPEEYKITVYNSQRYKAIKDETT